VASFHVWASQGELPCKHSAAHDSVLCCCQAARSISQGYTLLEGNAGVRKRRFPLAGIALVTCKCVLHCCRDEPPPYVQIAQQVWDIIESGQGYTGNKPLAVPHNAYFKVCCECCTWGVLWSMARW
jgi:hypothetical protein